MKKLFLSLMLIILLSGCNSNTSQECNDNEVLINGICQTKNEEQQDIDLEEEEDILVECSENQIFVSGACINPVDFSVHPQVEILDKTESTLRFDITIKENSQNVHITNIAIIQDNQVIQNLSLEERSISSLSKDTWYTLEISYTHDETNETKVINTYFKTYGDLYTPFVILEVIGEASTSAMLKIDATDERGLITYDALIITDENGLKTEYDYNPLLTVYELDMLSEYTYEVKYHYNMGEEDVYETKSIDFTTISPQLNYFIDIALESEFGASRNYVIKWVEPIKIYVEGNPSSSLMTELNNIIEELNSLMTDGTSLEIVEEKEDSNFIIVLESGDYFIEHYNIDETLVEYNWGLITVMDNEDGIIENGVMYVDIYRADHTASFHLLREELTQGLGLLQDTNQYENSIFYGKWTTTNAYAEIDRDLIWLLYREEVLPGMTEEELIEVLTPIIKEGIR